MPISITYVQRQESIGLIARVECEQLERILYVLRDIDNIAFERLGGYVLEMLKRVSRHEKILFMEIDVRRIFERVLWELLCLYGSHRSLDEGYGRAVV